MYENLAILAVFVFIYSAASKGLERTPVSGAILFTAFGLVLGPLGLAMLKFEVDAEGLRTLAEVTLALLLFTDAAKTDLGVLKKTLVIPQRLLLLALPLTILLGFGAGVLLFKGLTLLEIALLATLLAPTDAALGKPVVTDETIPEDIRESLNVESGLNDGICVPILLVFLALATGSHAEGGALKLAVTLVVEEIGIGAVVGVVLTVFGSWLLRRFEERGWITETWRQVPVAAMALACFATAPLLGGSGFIAAFVGGLIFGRIAKERKHRLLVATEGTGDTLALLTWVGFGVGVVGHGVHNVTWQVVLYAVLSLTVVRMLPTFLALSGLRLRTDVKLFVGWFGPRGLASIVFAVIVVNEQLPGGSTIAATAVCTILFSILGHGLTAKPLARALGTRLSRARDKAQDNKQ